MAVIAYFAYPVGLEAATKFARRHAFPSICNFEHFLTVRLLKNNEHTEFHRALTPATWQANKSRFAGRVTFEDGVYPGFALCHINANWKNYSLLTFGAFSVEKEPVELHCRIHDSHHNNQYTDRFNFKRIIKPGGNSIEIPLREVAKAPNGRVMDMSAIKCIGIFMVKPLHPVTVYFDDFRLEDR